MSFILTVLGALLIGWGGYVLVTGDFVATLDIAAGLVGSGVGVIALGAVVSALNRIARQLAERPVAVPPPPIHVPQPAPAPQARPSAPPPAPAAPPEAPAPSLVREGDIEGRHYRFFSDGSIEAEGPNGMRRYRSIDEARAQLMRERSETPDHIPAAPPAPSARPAPPLRHEGSRPARPPEEPPRASREPVSWESYLTAGRSTGLGTAAANPAPMPNAEDDDQWSEPFRMLLKGSDTASPEEPKSGRRR